MKALSLSQSHIHKAAFESLSIAYVWLSLAENLGQKMLHFPFCYSLSVTLKYAKNAFAAGKWHPTVLVNAPRTPIPHPPRRLRRLESRTFGARPSTTPHCFFDKSNTGIIFISAVDKGTKRYRSCLLTKNATFQLPIGLVYRNK